MSSPSGDYNTLGANTGGVDLVATPFSGGAQSPMGETPKMNWDSIENLWIKSWIKSRNYSPKTKGFLLDGATGYIECMKLYVGAGGIVGGSIDIPDITTANSFHTDASGNSWWGATTFASAPAKISNLGAITGSSVTITGGSVAGATITAASLTGAQLQNATITATQIASATITASNIANATITTTQISGTAGITGTQIANATIAATNITNGTITATQIANGAITSTQIANATIVATNISATAAITGSQLSSTAGIVGAQIANTTITGANILNNTITVGKVNIPTHFITATWTDDSPETNSVSWANATMDYNGTTYTITSGNTDKKYIWWDFSLSTTTFQVADALPTLADQDCLIAENTAGVHRLIWNATDVSGSQIQLAAITGANIANSTIAGSNLINNTITATQIANATITGSQIAGTTIAASNIISNTITATQIANATITTTQISATAGITGSQIASATITSDNITNATIVSGDIASATITATNIANNTITATQIANNTITATQIANNTITATQIANTTITASQIAALTITASEIANLTITTGKIVSLNIDKLNAGTITSKAITLAASDADCYINSGKTAFDNTQSGFILGIDYNGTTNPAKFYIGDATTYFNWDGSTLSIKGSLTITGGSGIANLTDAGNLATLDTVGTGQVDTTIISGGKIVTGLLTADNIQAGTLTGRTVQTAASGARVVLDGTNYLQAYSATALRVKLNTTNLTFYDPNGVEGGTIEGIADGPVSGFYFGCDFGEFAADLFVDVALDVGGNITVGGTVDGVDIASHASNASAHHSSTSSGIAITPTSYTGGAVTCNSGSIDQTDANGRIRQYLGGFRKRAEPGTPDSAECYVYFDTSTSKLYAKIGTTLYVLAG